MARGELQEPHFIPPVSPIPARQPTTITIIITTMSAPQPGQQQSTFRPAKHWEREKQSIDTNQSTYRL
jgi:hypothetical protein